MRACTCCIRKPAADPTETESPPAALFIHPRTLLGWVRRLQLAGSSASGGREPTIEVAARNPCPPGCTRIHGCTRESRYNLSLVSKSNSRVLVE